MANEITNRTVRLADGTAIPLLGFGTWQIPDDEAEAAVTEALRVGYRHLDTATVYRNERGVGAGLANAGVPREEVYVTTKIPPQNADRVRQTLEESLQKLGLDRVDLWLVHAPGGDDRDDPLVECWQEMITLRDEGMVTSLGVSNYALEQLDALTEATGVTPQVNQIRWAPVLADPRIAAGHQSRQVVLEGYSPFRASDLEDSTLSEVAQAHGITVPEVIMAWHVARGYVVIPKSTRPERIASNAAATTIELTAEELARVDGLGHR